MKALLNITPRLVMVTILFALISPALMANTNVATLQGKEQNPGEIIAAFILLVLVILLPLTRKRNATPVK